MPSDEQKKLKDYLLKSSLPLEQVVAELLMSSGYYVGGEYSYVKKNETGHDIECSIDISASRRLTSVDEGTHWGDCNLLVECKYCYPGMQWVFSQNPHPQAPALTTIACLDGLSRIQIRDRLRLYTYGRELEFCSRGVSIHSSGFDPNAITHGAEQLRYGLPSYYIECYEDAMPNPLIPFVTAMLVTTADLRVIRLNQSIERMQSAGSIEDFTDRVDALVLHQALGHQLSEYATKRMWAFSGATKVQGILDELEAADREAGKSTANGASAKFRATIRPIAKEH